MRGGRRWLLGGTALVLAAASDGCAASGSADVTPVCAPGDFQHCACDNGTEGERPCLLDGSDYGACVCHEPDTGTPDTTPPDTGKADTGAPDTTPPDTGKADTGAPDTTTADTLQPDTAVGDSVSADTGATDSGATDTGFDAASNPCGAFSSGGTCNAGNTGYTYCSMPAGGSAATLHSVVCRTYEQCAIASAGYAYCALKPGACYPGSTQCSGGNLFKCSASASWSGTTCGAAGCISTATGSACASSGATMKYTGTIQYQKKVPNAAWNDWGPKNTYLAPGVYIEVVVNDSVFSSTTTDASGSFAVDIPSPPSTATTIYAIPVSFDSSHQIRYAVASPGFSVTGEHAPTETNGSLGSDASIVSMSWDPVSLPSGSVLLPAEDTTSGWFAVFDYVRFVYESLETRMGLPGRRLIVWMQPNVTWSCGACASRSEAKLRFWSVGSQLWLPMDASNQGYWSDAVTTHELGHWVMGSYGFADAIEAGTHYLGCKTLPGQAWSEGWATGFSSLARDSSVYFDKQNNSFFWVDIGNRTGTASMPAKPVFSAGMLQTMGENDVAGIVWKLSKAPATAGTRLDASNAFLLYGISGNRMTLPPFERGYVLHQWDDVSPSCAFTNVRSYSGYPVAILPDYLDALECAGSVTSTAVNTVVSAYNYPYPAASPICR